jgi:hypothetical protein
MRWLINKVKSLFTKRSKNMKLSQIQAGVVANGGTVFNIKSIKTGNTMQVIGKNFAGTKFLVKMTSGEKAGQFVEVEDSERYQLVEGVLEANVRLKKEIAEKMAAISAEIEGLQGQMETKEQELDDLEQQLGRLVG